MRKFKRSSEKNQTLLCVGIDPDIEKLPVHLRTIPEGILEFNRRIIAATKNSVCAYKLNLAFFEVFGAHYHDILTKTIKEIPADIPVIGDAKRADIGNTSKFYAKTLFENFNFDAITANPYLGYDAIEPFIEYKERHIFVLCKTSNPGSKDIQNTKYETQNVKYGTIFEKVAHLTKKWNEKNHNVGVVVGATYPRELKVIREIITLDMPILIPGIGAQQGDLKKAVIYGTNNFRAPALINVSRAILYASSDDNFDKRAYESAENIKNEIRELIRKI